MRCQLLVLVGLVEIRAAGADAPAPPVVDEETIEITDLRVPRLPADAPPSVTVLEREDLERTPAPLTDDVLRTVPSVAMFRRSSSLIADPTSQGVNLRGLAPSGVSRALVLRDGIPLNDPFGGWVYWRAIPRGSIQRIEIQPSGASVFGNFGLGGAIGIASRPITAQTVEAELVGGSYGTLLGAARGTDRLGRLGLELDAQAFRSDGYAPIAAADRGAVDGPAASDHLAGGVRAEYSSGRSTLRGFGRVFDQHLDAGTLYTTADVRTFTYGASWRLDQPGWRLDVTGFGGTQVFEQQRARVNADRSMAAVASAQETPSNNQGASAMWTARLHPRHTLQVGVDGVRVSGTATDALTPAMSTEASVIERAAGGEQRFLGVFVQDSIRASRMLELGASLRVDGWQQRAGERRVTRASGDVEVTPFDDRGELQVSPRLGALQRLGEHLAVRASVYRAFRAPTLNELYRPFQVGTVLTAANAALRPEVLWGGEAGTQLVVGTLVGRATAFWNRLADPIYNATLAMPVEGAGRMRQNLGRARVAGLELETSWRPHAEWTTSIAYTFVDATVTEAPDHAELVGKWLAQDPRHRASARVTYEDPAIVTLTAELRYTGRQFEDDLNTRLMGAYAVVDLLARRELAFGLSAFATALNVFDRRYLVGRAGVDTIGAPRSVLVGLSFATGAKP